MLPLHIRFHAQKNPPTTSRSSGSIKKRSRVVRFAFGSDKEELFLAGKFPLFLDDFKEGMRPPTFKAFSNMRETLNDAAFFEDFSCRTAAGVTRGPIM